MKIRIKKKIEEISAVGAAGIGSDIQGHSGRRRKDNSEKIEEMFSSQALMGRVIKLKISGEKEHAGHVERSKQQGLRNVMEDVEDTLDLDNPDNLGPLDRSIARETEPEEAPEGATQAQLNYKNIYQIVLERGYRLIETLGSGQYGMVFSAEDLSTGGDYVVKVVGQGEAMTPISQGEIDRELRNYSTVAQAAAGDERMWRHFPETYDTWKESLLDRDLGFIVMEKLVPLTEDESAFIPDLNYVIARKKPMDAAVVDDYGEGRDQSLKAKWYAQNELDSLYWEVESAFARVVGFGYEYGTNRDLDNIAASFHPSRLGRYERMQDSSPEKIENLIQKRLNFARDNLSDRILFTFMDYYSIMREEVQNAPHTILILLDLMTAIVRAGELEETLEQTIQREIQSVATAFINGYRKAVGIPLSFNTRDIEQDEKTRANYHSPGKDLFRAIQLLHKKTGLIAKDVHDQNVMKREGSGDIVIVDLGLFKMDPDFDSNVIKEDLKETTTKGFSYRIKILTNR